MRKVVLTEKVKLGNGAGGYRFKIEEPTLHDQQLYSELYETGKRFRELAKQSQTSTIKDRNRL
jgi:hypothetical protein